MAELEIHHEGHEADPLGRRVGVQAALIAVLLAIVTIVSHRAHTDAVLVKSEANDNWSFYQSKRIKYHSIELGEDLLNAMSSRTATAENILQRYGKQKNKYERESETAQKDAEEKDRQAARLEDKALRFDIGEGLLEIGLVLTSLYFIARSKLFPVVGIVATLVGAGIAALGFLT